MKTPKTPENQWYPLWCESLDHVLLQTCMWLTTFMSAFYDHDKDTIENESFNVLESFLSI